MTTRTRTQPIPKTACALYNFFRLSSEANVALSQQPEEMDKKRIKCKQQGKE